MLVASLCLATAAALDALGNGTLAAHHMIRRIRSGQERRLYECGWERATFLLGVTELSRRTKDAELTAFAEDWARHYAYKLCTTDGPHRHHGLGGA